MIDSFHLHKFIQESNQIEGIFGTPSEQDVRVAKAFLEKKFLTVDDLCELVAHFQPGASIRSKAGMNVRVGNHLPPVGGMSIVYGLDNLLGILNSDPKSITPYQMHRAYENLHPFTDGNGRSGRLLYAYHCLKIGRDRFLRLGFLHNWYYESLDHDPLRHAPQPGYKKCFDLPPLERVDMEA